MMTTEKISADTRREHIEELAAAYSLGALTDHNDLEEFQQLVESGDPALAASLEEMLEASSALAIAAPIVIPPVSIRESLLASASAQKISTGGKSPLIDEHTLDAMRLKKRTRIFFGVGILAGLLICYLLALNVSSTAKLERSNDLMRQLLRQTDSLRTLGGFAGDINPASARGGEEAEQKINQSRQFFTSFGDPDLRLVTLASAPLGAARQHLIYSPKKKMVYLVPDHTGTLDAGKTYMLIAKESFRTPTILGKFQFDPNKDPQVYSFAVNLRNPNLFSIATDPDHKVIFTGEMGKD